MRSKSLIVAALAALPLCAAAQDAYEIGRAHV